MSARKLSRLAGLVLALAVAFGGAGLAGISSHASSTHAAAATAATLTSGEWD